MIRKVINIGLALMASAVCAHANMADTRAESDTRYGQPIKVVGSWLVYHCRGWVITEWLNADGLVEAIYYMKQHGNVTKEEFQKFYQVNLPAYMQGQDNWTELQANASNYRVWTSLDEVWRYESGAEQRGKYTYAYLNIMTTRACAAITSQQNGNSNETKPVTNTEILPL